MALKAITLGAIALGLGAVLTNGMAALRADRITAAFPPVGEFVSVTGGRVHYVQAGQGPDVILLHGAGGNLRDYTFALMDQLTDRYRVTAFDRPGMGYTDRVPGIATGAFATEGDSPAAQVAMLREAAGALGITAPIVVGHSFGGIVALAWATTGLDRDDPTNASAVVSYAGVAMPWPGSLGSYYMVNGSTLGGVVIPLISAFVPKSKVDDVVTTTFAPQAPPAGYIAHLGGELALRPGAFRANVRQVNTLRPFVVDMAQLYPQLTIPIEIIHGTADTVVPIHVHAAELVKIAPTANLVRLDGIGHQPHHSRQPEAIAAIDRAAARAGLR